MEILFIAILLIGLVALLYVCVLLRDIRMDIEILSLEQSRLASRLERIKGELEQKQSKTLLKG
jgi:hypothetical protein